MNAAFFLLLYQPDKPALTADSHVQISVRCKNHPIISSRNKILFRQLIGFLNPRLPSRGAACLQILKGSRNFCLIFSGHAVQNYRFITRISDNRHPIPFIQIFCQHSESLLHQRQLIIGIHGTRHIQQKYKVGCRTVFKINFLCLQSDHQKTMLLIPRTIRIFCCHRKRLISPGLRIIIIKIIDQFLNPHCICWNTASGTNHPTDVSIRSSIHVYRKCRKRTVCHIPVAVLLNIAVFFCITILRSICFLVFSSHSSVFTGCRDCCFAFHLICHFSVCTVIPSFLGCRSIFCLSLPVFSHGFLHCPFIIGSCFHCSL